MNILQRDLNRSTFVCVRNEEERVCSALQISFQILISGKIITEMPGSVASGTPCILIS
jgi:hypothetical protein